MGFVSICCLGERAVKAEGVGAVVGAGLGAVVWTGDGAGAV